jgi:hypothetical protein
VLPAAASNEVGRRKSGREIARRERTDRCRNRAVRRGTRFDAEPLHAAPKCGAYAEDSSGHGHFPAAMHSSSSSTVSSM